MLQQNIILTNVNNTETIARVLLILIDYYRKRDKRERGFDLISLSLSLPRNVGDKENTRCAQRRSSIKRLK